MRVANNNSIELFHDWTLRVRSPAAASNRPLLMLHGWTGDENSMWVFVRRFPLDRWFLAPRGLHPAAGNGFSWRAFRADSFGRPSLDDLQDSAKALVRLMDSYTGEHQIGSNQFDVLGFSQGAALSNVLICLYPDRIHRAGILAGFMPSGMESLLAQKPLAGRRIFVAHGTQDDLIPIERARASMSMLEQAGADVTYCESEVGHQVSANCLRALRSFFEN